MEKRARTDEPAEADVASRKTRAPYVSKACDTCRWRKSKCDGNQPCGHCDLYSKTCHYSTTRDNNASNANTARVPFQQRTDKDLSFSTIDQLGGLLTDLHTQLATLTARMDIAQCQDGCRAPLGGTHIVSSNLNSKIAVGPSPRLRFCGPTSPNFSLNMAQIKLTDYEDNSPNKRPRLPTMDEDMSDRDVDSISDSYTHHMHANSSAISSDRTLAHLNAFATLDQALRLLETYQETIGNFHPILDFARLKQHAEKCFSKTTSGDIALDEDDFITLHLALSIALVAEGKSSIRLERSRLGCVFDMANSRITSPAATVTQVTVALLMGFHAFFGDDIQVAWRMCGLAGRMAMELGLHCYDAARGSPSPETERWQKLSVLLSTIFILDRQWSASAGLPNQFTETSFDQNIFTACPSHYLNAMVAFCLISDKFAEPITQVAQGLCYDNDDELELIDFKIDQWRRKFVLGYSNFERPDQWTAAGPPETIPPSALILYLRANSVRGMLLRSSLISERDTSRGKIQSALDIVSETLDTLEILHNKSSIYRRLRPHFQHILASASALLCLVAGKVGDDGHSDCSACHCAATISRNYQTALRLSASYASSSPASWRLHKRLDAMQNAMNRLGSSPRNNAPSAQKTSTAQGAGPAQRNTVDEFNGSLTSMPECTPFPDFTNSLFPFDTALPTMTLDGFDALGSTSADGWLWKV